MDGNYEGATHTYIYATLDNIKEPIITERYSLPDQVKQELLSSKTPFTSAYAECVYLRTYSRKRKDGSKESWAGTVIRVIEGTIEAYLTHYKKNGLSVDYKWLDKFSSEMARSFFRREWSPPGRGLYAMGTEHTRKNGNAALNNCYACETKNLVLAAAWTCDNLMCGGGVGFDCSWDGVACRPNKEDCFTFVISDTRQGWVAATELLLRSYIPIDGKITNKFPKFDFTLIRPYGEPIKGFGGTASGPEPLKALLDRIEIFLDTYLSYQDWEKRYKEEEPNDYISEDSFRTEKRGIFINMARRLHAVGAYTYGNFEEELKKLNEALGKHNKTYGKTRLVVDIMNSIGCTVVAGNVRRCLPGDALVHTKAGLKPILEVKVGDEVLTYDGYYPITEHLKQGKQELVKIITQDGEFRCTPNHKMAVFASPTDYRWKQASRLEPGDRLVSTRCAIPGRETQLPACHYERPAHSTTYKDIILPSLDPDMAWLIGIFQTDGYTYPNYEKKGFNAYVSLVFGIDELDIAKKAQKQLERFGDFLRVTLKKRKNENSYIVHCQSKQLSWYFDQHVKQAKKVIRVPEYIREGTLPVRLAYIAGILDGDGSAEGRHLNIMSSVYLDWVKEVQALCYSCGFETRVKEQKKEWANREGWQFIHKLNVITLNARNIVMNIPELCKDIPMRAKSQQAGGFPKEWLPKYYPNQQMNIDVYEREYGCVSAHPTEVIAVIQDSIEETYDISVKDRHEFFCNGYLTHNSAMISIGDADDREFLDLKNHSINPERSSISWMSNNTVRLSKNEDFEKYIPEIAKRIRDNGEPGFFNLINARKYGRYTDTDYGEDPGNLLNPCAEIILQSFEPCTLSTVCPSNCLNIDKKVDLNICLQAARYATFYATTVTCIKHHWGITNAVIAHNRRIGVSLTGIADVYEGYGFTYLTTICRNLYKEIRSCNAEFAAKAGIPRAIRVTTVKPEGSLSIIHETGAGIHFPICRFAKRRIGFGKDDPLVESLKGAGYLTEDSSYSPTMIYVIFPLSSKNCRSEREVSIYEQFGLVSALQRCYSDNSVSFTGHFSIERESKDVERVIAMFAPQIKSCSLLPYSDDTSQKQPYKHMPFEEILEEEYKQLAASIKPVQWFNQGNDATIERGCTNDSCMLG